MYLIIGHLCYWFEAPVLRIDEDQTFEYYWNIQDRLCQCFTTEFEYNLLNVQLSVYNVREICKTYTGTSTIQLPRLTDATIPFPQDQTMC